jgi:hypothetical protein
VAESGLADSHRGRVGHPSVPLMAELDQALRIHLNLWLTGDRSEASWASSGLTEEAQPSILAKLDAPTGHATASQVAQCCRRTAGFGAVAISGNP